MIPVVESKLAEAPRQLADHVPLNYLNADVLKVLSSQCGPLAVACSGGIDSIALLLLIYGHFPEHRKHLYVLHYNHKIRKESKDEALFIQECCNKLGVNFTVGEITDDIVDDSEAALRKKRHAFFRDSLKKVSAQFLILGQHADDVAETMLMRLARGSGTSGLCAPRPITEHQGGITYLRPLINIRKKTLIELCKKLGIRWCEDVSNVSSRYLRNRLRLSVLPVWETAVGEDLYKGVGRSRSLLQDDDEALNLWVNSLVEIKQGKMSLAGLINKPKALYRRALHLFLLNQGISKVLTAKGLDKVLENIYDGLSVKVSLGNDTSLHFEDNVLWLERKKAECAWRVKTFLCDQGFTIFPDGTYLEAQVVKIDEGLRHSVLSGMIDPQKSVFLSIYDNEDFFVRQWEPGDRYQPIGGPGTRKLQDMYTDRKIPAEQRSRLPVVVGSRRGIAWCPGLPVSDNFKVLIETSYALKLTYCINH